MGRRGLTGTWRSHVYDNPHPVLLEIYLQRYLQRAKPAKKEKSPGASTGRHSPRAPLPQSHATAAHCGPFQAWTSPLHPGQAWAQPLRGSGLDHTFHCKTSQPLPMDNWQLPTGIDCHQFFKNSSFRETGTAAPSGPEVSARGGRSPCISDYGLLSYLTKSEDRYKLTGKKKPRSASTLGVVAPINQLESLKDAARILPTRTL